NRSTLGRVARAIEISWDGRFRLFEQVVMRDRPQRTRAAAGPERSRGAHDRSPSITLCTSSFASPICSSSSAMSRTVDHGHRAGAGTDRFREGSLATIAHYNLLDQLDPAGPGDLYRARDTAKGRTVAVRLLPADFTSDRAKLIDTARALTVLSHPNRSE